MKKAIQKEIAEYNEKYSGLMKFHPEAIKLRNNIEYHKKKYEYVKSQLSKE